MIYFLVKERKVSIDFFSFVLHIFLHNQNTAPQSNGAKKILSRVFSSKLSLEFIFASF